MGYPGLAGVQGTLLGHVFWLSVGLKGVQLACSEILPYSISKHGKSGRVSQKMYSLSKLKYYIRQTQEVRRRGKGFEGNFSRSDKSLTIDRFQATYLPVLPYLLVFSLCWFFPPVGYCHSDCPSEALT